MGEQNKILDVTYGKFSCRLEGFDDAVETMKAVVSFFQETTGSENFHEIASGMPDLDTLAQLAEAQSGGTVEVARMGSGVSLTRFADDDAEADETDATVGLEDDRDGSPDMQAEDTVDENEEPSVGDIAATEDTPGDEDDPSTEETVDTGVVAASDDALDEYEDGSLPEEADIAAAEAPVSAFDMDAAAEVAGSMTDEAEVSDPEGDHAAEEEGTAAAEHGLTIEDFEETPPAAGDDVSEMMAEEHEMTSAMDDEDASAAGLAAHEQPVAEMPDDTDDGDTGDEDDDDDDDDSFTNRLDRIRAVVSRGVASPREIDDEAAPAETPSLRPGNPLAQRLAELAKRNSELMQDDDRAISPIERQEDAPVTGAAEPESGDDTDDWTSEGEAPELDDVALAQDDDHGDMAGGEGIEDPAEPDTDEEPRSARDEAPEAETEGDDGLDVAASDDGNDGTDDTASEDDRTQSEPTAERPLLLTTPQRPVSEEAVTDEDDDFDLSAEVAEIEKELAARPRDGMTRHGLRRVEDAMSRIFNETNHQLDEPEGRRHRDALAQLKAAVAATEAAKQLGDNTRSRDAGETYRDDLGALDAENRTAPEGLPPLKLVTSDDDKSDRDTGGDEEADDNAQALSGGRVTSKPLDTAADRLREIAATKDAGSAGNTEDFVAFIERQGLTDLGDKLEAAAAYLTFVEGEADFTRPQLMRLVQSASREEITREDGLRCFGRLLRQARFSKLNNGRFKVDENTPFRPRSSRAAQG